MTDKEIANTIWNVSWRLALRVLGIIVVIYLLGAILLGLLVGIPYYNSLSPTVVVPIEHPTP